MSDTSSLHATARALVAPGKGLLAADESTSTIEKRLKDINVPNTEDNRRAYRDMLFTAPGLGEFISGVILYDETLRQTRKSGLSFVDLLAGQGIIPGIKVDEGAKALAGFPGDKITEGLDGLRERFAEYAKLGARFAKWRAVIEIGANIPSDTALDENAHALARYAALSQEAGIVPIVEPEVLMDGAHPLSRHFEVTEAMQRRVFAALAEHRVDLKGMLLKPNMILPGTKGEKKASIAEVAEATLRCLRQTVPAAVPGIVFLSGGQGDEDAAAHLDALNRLGQAPWTLTFSYGRALQATSLKAWGGKLENVAAGQEALLKRARLNSAAQKGQYTSAMEKAS